MLGEDDDDEEKEPRSDPLRPVASDPQKKMEQAEQDREVVLVREPAQVPVQVMFDQVEMMMRELARQAGDAMARKWTERAPVPEGVPDFTGEINGALFNPHLRHRRIFNPDPRTGLVPQTGSPNLPSWMRPNQGAAVIRQAENLLNKGVSAKVVAQSVRGAGVVLKQRLAFGAKAASKTGILMWATVLYIMVSADTAHAREHMFEEWKKAGLMSPDWKGTGWYTGAGEFFPGILG